MLDFAITNNRRVPLGSFETKEQAAEARREAEQRIRKHLEDKFETLSTYKGYNKTDHPMRWPQG